MIALLHSNTVLKKSYLQTNRTIIDNNKSSAINQKEMH